MRRWTTTFVIIRVVPDVELEHFFFELKTKPVVVGRVRIHQGKTHLDVAHLGRVVGHAEHQRLSINTLEEDTHYTVTIARGSTQHFILPNLDLGVSSQAS